tara:strand:+ start:707 stop:1081 length:375 start_codon:yes stop_codon:yes gene_type:complete
MGISQIELSQFYIELIGFTLTLIVSLGIKDWAVSFIEGMKFKMHKAFNEGDKVLLDDEEALIVRIGLTETVFGIYGSDGYTWRYIPNARIKYSKLEKIVDPNLHPDTAQETARKMKEIMNAKNK